MYHKDKSGSLFVSFNWEAFGEREENQILSDFVAKIAKPATKILKKPMIQSITKNLPACSLRVAKVHADKNRFLLACGKRWLVEETDNFDELGLTLAVEECVRCGGFTSVMVKHGDVTRCKLEENDNSSSKYKKVKKWE